MVRRQNPKSLVVKKSHKGWRSDLGHYARSNWEANIARVFKYTKSKYLYEPATFDLLETVYTPDFYLVDHNTFIEVKGRWGHIDKFKYETFKTLYPLLKIQVIDQAAYEEMKAKYRSLIKEWE